MEKIRWCMKEPNGIRIIRPNLELANSYMERAKADFSEMQKHDSVWKVIIAYYSCYNALYAVLIRYGLRSRLHSCTMAAMKFFKSLWKYHDFMILMKEKRHNTQYYLKRENINLPEIEEFVMACEQEIMRCNQKRIDGILKKLHF